MNKKILATFMALGMVITAFAVLTSAQPSHTFMTTTDGATGNIGNAGDGTDPEDGLARHYIRTRPGEVAFGPTVPNPPTDHCVIGDIMDHYAQVDSEGFASPSVNGDPVIMIIEHDENATLTADGQISADGTVPKGYVASPPELAYNWPGDPQWLGASTLTAIPTTTFTVTNVNWAAIGIPNVYGYGVLESNNVADNNGPWTERGQSTGTTLAYAPVANHYYALVIYWRGTDAGFLNTQAVRGLVWGMPQLYLPPVADTATITATNPAIGTPTTDQTPQVTYTHTGSPASVDLYYWNGAVWTFWETDNAPGASPRTFQTTVNIPAGSWGLMAKSPGEAAPSGGASVEVTPYIVDLTAPTITVTSPADGATGVAVTDNVVVTFSEAMNPASVTYTCAPNPGGWGVSWNGPLNTIATYTHANFAFLTPYIFTITAGTDVAGNALAAGAVPNPFDFTTADPNPPQTTITSVTPDPYIGTIPDDVVLLVNADDLEGSIPNAAQYQIDRNDDGDYLDAGEGWVAMTPVGVPAEPRDFTATIDLHGCPICTPNIQARASDNGGATYDATPAVYTYTISDTTAPLNTITSPTDETHKLIGAGATDVSGTVQDFQLVGAATLYWDIFGAVPPFANAVPMVYGGYVVGSYISSFSAAAAIPEPAAATHYVYYIQATDPSTVTGTSPIFDLYYDEASAAPSMPYAVKGFSQFYNGSHTAGYVPFNQPGVSVTLQTFNATGVLITLGPQITDALARYLFTLQPDQYALNGLIWVNFTYGTYLNYSTTIASTDGGESWVNGTFGIPAWMEIYWIPWWDGNGVPPPDNSYISGTAFYINVTVYDQYGNIAIGYYCYMEIETNETSPLSDLWPGTIAPDMAEFDGIGGTTTDGYYNDTVVLYTGGIWAIWVNATDGAGGPVTNLTWWIDGGSNGPQLEPSNQTWDYTHVYIAAGGFFWRPVAGWNLISIPKAIAPALLTAGQFLAPTAGQLVIAAAAGAGIPLTECALAAYTGGLNPATYDVYDAILASGVPFPMTIDFSYWLWVDVDLSAEGVFVQCDVTPFPDGEQNLNGELRWGVGEIDALGLNEVMLNAGWTMVNPCAGWTNTSAWVGGTALHTDTRGNQGAWSIGAEILTTGGGWTGINHAWYSQIILANALQGQDDAPGCWINDGNVIIQDCAAWYPSNSVVLLGTYTMNAYDAAFYGVQDMGTAGCNQAQRLFYANGFLVYSAGGGLIQYDSNYITLVPAPYNP